VIFWICLDLPNLEKNIYILYNNLLTMSSKIMKIVGFTKNLVHILCEKFFNKKQKFHSYWGPQNHCVAKKMHLGPLGDNTIRMCEKKLILFGFIDCKI